MRKIFLFALLVLTLGISSLAVSAATMFDFDGDGKADISVWRPSNGFWYVQKSSGGFSATQWGQAGDQIVPGDYDGDGKTDVAVYRRGSGSTLNDNSTWYIRRSSDNVFIARNFGRFSGLGRHDTPFPADYDGDGKFDLTIIPSIDAIILNSPNTFRILQSSTGEMRVEHFGLQTDRLVVPADYDGDGKDDLAVFRYVFGSKEAGVWHILQSLSGAVKSVAFGLPDDRLVPADYDGDGKADIAVFRPSNGFWYILGSRDGFRAEQFGALTDKPTPADYDGDGKTDIAVFRPSNGTWYLQQSREGFAAHVFGFPDDIPIPNVYVR